jgi:hypothetical protein
VVHPNFAANWRWLAPAGRRNYTSSQHLAEEGHAMPDVKEQMAQVVRNVIVEQKGHDPVDHICRATSTSISPR